jgi:hypothetical protein
MRCLIDEKKKTGGSKQIGCARVFLSIAILFLSATCATSARAQVSLQTQLDFQAARTDALLGTSSAPTNMPNFGSVVSFTAFPVKSPPPDQATGEGAGPIAPPPFTISVLNALGYYKNDGASASPEGAQTAPEVRGGFATPPNPIGLQFSGYLDATSSRATGGTAHSDLLDGTLRLDWVGLGTYANRDAPDIFLYYAPSRAFDPLFSTATQTTQDLSLGVNKLFDYFTNGPVPYPRAGFAQTYEVGIQVAGARRYVASGPDSDAVSVAPSIKWSAVDAAHFPGCEPEQCAPSASLALNVTRRWYDQVNEQSERAWSIQPTVTFAWPIPQDWFGSDLVASGKRQGQYGKPEIDFQVSYGEMNSTNRSHSGHQWTIGPTFRASW